MIFRASVAHSKINAQLQKAGAGSLSRSSFYNLRQAYTVFYPRSQKVIGNRFIYDDGVMLFLYFVARAQKLFGTNQAALFFVAEVQNRKPQGVRFVDLFPTFSAIDTFFEQQEISA